MSLEPKVRQERDALVERFRAALQQAMPDKIVKLSGWQFRVSDKTQVLAEFTIQLKFDTLYPATLRQLALAADYSLKIRKRAINYTGMLADAKRIAEGFSEQVYQAAIGLALSRQRHEEMNRRITQEMGGIAESIQPLEIKQKYHGYGSINPDGKTPVHLRSTGENYELTFTGLEPWQVWTIINEAFDKAGLEHGW